MRRISDGAAFRMIKLSAVSTLLLLSPPVFAYIDPGTGSALIQGLVAAVAAVGVTIKLYWHRIKAALGGKSDTQDEQVTAGERDDSGG